MTTTASDRVQVRSQGELMHPGACSLCGSGNCDDGYLDVGIWYEYEGQQYYCMNCVLQIIAVAGGLAPEIAEHLEETNRGLATKVAALTQELEEANELLLKWNGLINSVGLTDSTLNTLGTSLVDPVYQATDGSVGQVNVAEQAPVQSEPKPVKPVAGKRPPKSSKSSTGNSAGEFDI